MHLVKLLVFVWYFWGRKLGLTRFEQKLLVAARKKHKRFSLVNIYAVDYDLEHFEQPNKGELMCGHRDRAEYHLEDLITEHSDAIVEEVQQLIGQIFMCKILRQYVIQAHDQVFVCLFELLGWLRLIEAVQDCLYERNDSL